MPLVATEGSATQATPLPAGAAAVLAAKPDGRPVVAIAIVTVPGARSCACEGIACAMRKNVLTGKLVPLNATAAFGPDAPTPTMLPVEMTFDGLVSIRKRPSPCVPLFEEGASISEVD